MLLTVLCTSPSVSGKTGGSDASLTVVLPCTAYVGSHGAKQAAVRGWGE